MKKFIIWYKDNFPIKRTIIMLLLLTSIQISLDYFLGNYSGIIYASGFLIGMIYQGYYDIKGVD